eukprot:m.40353 g.40353  ORF g.40353 m.40353 type:complete len:67 (+) comp32960_c0_seq1:2226-2426(+)
MYSSFGGTSERPKGGKTVDSAYSPAADWLHILTFAYLRLFLSFPELCLESNPLEWVWFGRQPTDSA